MEDISPSIRLSHPSQVIEGISIPLPSSKSESNRALIIQALSQAPIDLSNLSTARDTQTMMRLLQSKDETLDVLDAGTTMRFLTAYCTAKNRKAILTGTKRMKERPIGLLVDALRSIGGKISYLEKEGYPPIKVEGFEQQSNSVNIRGDVSSQYISALLMIAPTLPQGLSINLEGEISSRPYIEMTLRLMTHFGIASQWNGKQITVEAQAYKSGKYSIESDWSGASYWYSVVSMANEGKIAIQGLRRNSWQGDRAMVEIMSQLGVQTQFIEAGVLLTPSKSATKFEYDFSSCPDLAQTIAVICAAKGIPANLTGLHSLRIKETDRIAAIQAELEKLGTKTVAIGDEALRIYPDQCEVSGQTINTYQDHRMAMAFSPLALLGELVIENSKVVDKSYPSFWEDMSAAGFVIEEVAE